LISRGPLYPPLLFKERGKKIKEGLTLLLDAPAFRGLRAKPLRAVLRLKDSSRRVGRKT